MDAIKIRELIFSSDEKNRLLGIQLDKSINRGQIRQELENAYQALIELLRIDLMALLGMSKIDLSGMELTFLPIIPPFIQEVNCKANQLTSLPELPNVKNLECYNNQLTSLPKLPNVQRLSCRDNQLISLPELPNVTYLYCNGNELTKLPELPSIQGIDVEDYLLDNWD